MIFNQNSNVLAHFLINIVSKHIVNGSTFYPVTTDVLWLWSLHAFHGITTLHFFVVIVTSFVPSILKSPARPTHHKAFTR